MTFVDKIITPDNTELPLGERKACEQCGKSFEPRSGSGGRAQRFCGPKCRTDFNNSERGSQQINGEPTNHQQINPKPQQINDTLGTEPTNDFDWASDEDIVLHEQQAIAIYFNKYQGLVIRQERGRYEDQDTIIIINRENIDAFLGRLTAVAGRK